MHPFTPRRSDSVAALGEERLIAAIRRWLGPASPPAPAGIGDDCAVLPPSRRQQLLTVDPVIYRQHFDDSIPPRAVGAKLLKRNLSDLAAMGAQPRAAVVALALDPHTSTRWLEQFYRGIAACARRYRVPVVGGDIAQVDGNVVASLTLLGEAAGPRVLLRTGARIGDWIYVTGALGRSLPTGHHWKFTPRLAEGAWLAQQPAVRAMMDISDGLAKDLRALTPPGAAPALIAADLPRRDRANVRAALADGEDYELVFAIGARIDRNAFAAKWRKKFPRVRLACIGRFVSADALPADAVHLGDFRGFEYLRSTGARNQ